MEKSEMPIFVKLDEYKDMLDIVAMIKAKVGDARLILDKINELKKEEEVSIANWQNELEDIDKTVDAIDKMLFEPEFQ